MYGSAVLDNGDDCSPNPLCPHHLWLRDRLEQLERQRERERKQREQLQKEQRDHKERERRGGDDRRKERDSRREGLNTSNNRQVSNNSSVYGKVECSIRLEKLFCLIKAVKNLNRHWKVRWLGLP